MNDDAIEAAMEIAGIFESMEVPYMVGGSLASTAWSIPRFTLDVDVIAALEDHHVSPFTEALADGWYMNEAMIREAIERRASFNVIRLRGMVKVDVFVPPDEGLHRSKWGRVQYAVLDPDGDRPLAITSPEDIVLQKLDWYRRGEEVSEQQWVDVTTLLRIQGERLDHGYLDEWAERMQLTDLLERARADS